MDYESFIANNEQKKVIASKLLHIGCRQEHLDRFVIREKSTGDFLCLTTVSSADQSLQYVYSIGDQQGWVLWDNLQLRFPSKDGLVSKKSIMPKIESLFSAVLKRRSPRFILQA